MGSNPIVVFERIRMKKIAGFQLEELVKIYKDNEIVKALIQRICELEEELKRKGVNPHD